MSENNFSHSYNFFLVWRENQYPEVKYQKNSNHEKNKQNISGPVRKIKIIKQSRQTLLKINTFPKLNPISSIF